MASVIGFFVGFFMIGPLSSGAHGYIIGGVVGYLLVQLSQLKDKISNLERKLASTAISHDKESNTQTVIEEKQATPSTSTVNIPNQTAETKEEPLESTDKTENKTCAVTESISDDILVQSIEPLSTEQSSNHTNTDEVDDKKPTQKTSLNESQNISTSQELAEKASENAINKSNDEAVFIAPSLFELGYAKVKSLIIAYFTNGNALVRTGMLVLFIGVAFLLKYVSERTSFPVEYRYIAVGLACLGMMILGWRLRDKRPGFALSIEGGSIGLLYLTLFAALRLHGLLSPHLVLFLLVTLVVFSAVLAVVQDSMALAVIGMIGGFAAPILTSTGHGSHVQLFSYYLLLNVGVFAIAWFKSWRTLNLIGFVATFGIGSLWGFKFYKPEFFTSVEPFLLAYFLLYTFIAVLFALKQAPKLKGLNDGSLVFGSPLIGFALQAALLKDSEYGLAYSALVLGLFYIVLALIIHAMKKPYMKNLIESFAALGIGFATLAIPLAFDGRVTSAMWAVEGCALLWVGIKQSRLLPRFSGYALTFLGMIAFFFEQKSSSELSAWLNSDYMGGLLIFLSTSFIALYARRHKDQLLLIEKSWIPPMMIVLSTSWWVYAGLFEIHSHYSSLRFVLAESFLAFSCLAMLFISYKINFKIVKVLSTFVALLMLGLLSIYLPHISAKNSAFLNSGFVGLMLFSLSHMYLSWYWHSDKRHLLAASFNGYGLVFLITGLGIWLYAWTQELNFYYREHQFILLEIMLALTALTVLFLAVKLRLKYYKLASVGVTLLMILPLSVIPASHQSLTALANIPFVGLFIYTALHLFMSWFWQRDKTPSISLLPMKISNALWLIGMFAWVYTGHNEISAYLSAQSAMHLSLVFMSVSFVVWLLLAQKFKWKMMQMMNYLFLPYLLFMSYFSLVNNYHFHQSYGLLSWMLAALINYWILKISDRSDREFKSAYHLTSLLLFVFIAVYEFDQLIIFTFTKGTIWQHMATSFILLLLVMGLYKIRKVQLWPFSKYRRVYFHHALLGLSALLWLMLISANLLPPGKATLIKYLPVLNIIDMLGIVFIFFAWKVLSNKETLTVRSTNILMNIALPATAFLMLNASMLRTFHFWFDIHYKFTALVSSFIIQSAFSILWSLTAVILMVLASKKSWRLVWLVGLGLMIAVVLKLFLVDMSASGTVARIVAFLSVGLLLSLVGYFSPLPPEAANSHSSDQT